MGHFTLDRQLLPGHSSLGPRDGGFRLVKARGGPIDRGTTPVQRFLGLREVPGPPALKIHDALIEQSLPFVSLPLPGISQLVAQVGAPVALVGGMLTQLGLTVAFIGGMLTPLRVRTGGAMLPGAVLGRRHSRSVGALTGEGKLLSGQRKPDRCDSMGKLVRDRIPDLIRVDGGIVTAHVLNDHEFAAALRT